MRAVGSCETTAGECDEVVGARGRDATELWSLLGMSSESCEGVVRELCYSPGIIADRSAHSLRSVGVGASCGDAVGELWDSWRSFWNSFGILL